MALAETTLSAACTADQAFIVVTSATSVAAGNIVLIDGEQMKVTRAYVTASTTVPVLRAQGGTLGFAHPSGAAVEHGVASDFGTQAAQTDVNFPIAGKAIDIRSYSADGAIDLPSPGSNRIALLNAVSTTVLAMTVALPTKDMDGCELLIASRNGTGAHTITFAGRLNGAPSGNYTIYTFPAGPNLIRCVAIDSFWYVASAPAWTGTVTLLVGGVS